MDHVHYIDHQHWTEGTTGGCSDRGTSTDGYHAHYTTTWIGGPWVEGSGSWMISARESAYNGNPLTVGDNGSHSHTINDHTHWWGNWSGWAMWVDHVSGRPYSDGAVKHNGTQYVDRSWTDYNGNAANQECRPKNYTIRIWRRKA